MARQTSEPASGSDSKVYEMFTYSIKPEAFGKEEDNHVIYGFPGIPGRTEDSKSEPE